MNARLRKACLSAFLGLACASALAQESPPARLTEPASFLQGISAVQGQLSNRDSLYAALQGQQSQAIERLGDVRARESNGVAARYALADGRRVLAALTVNLARDEALFYFLSYPAQASEADEPPCKPCFSLCCTPLKR